MFTIVGHKSKSLSPRRMEPMPFRIPALATDPLGDLWRAWPCVRFVQEMCPASVYDETVKGGEQGTHLVNYNHCSSINKL